MSIFDDIGQFLSDVWNAITEVFSPSPPPAPTQPCPAVHFEATIVGVGFNSPVTAGRRGAAVAGEQWTDGVDVNEPNVSDGSMKPAIVLVAGRGEPGMTVRIRVTRSQNVGSTGPVTGYLGNLTFEGVDPCPTAVGDHTINAKIAALPTSIARDAGDATWSMVVDPIGSVALGSTRLEVVTILDNPAPCFAGGDWIEALRAICSLGILGISEKRQAAATVARSCHADFGAVYDTVSGAPKFNSGHYGANGYLLAKYISPGSGKVVNCYDQAAAVSALSGAFGVYLGWKYMDPFGFLAQSDLVGVGPCNNPFFNGTNWKHEPNYPSPMAPPLDPHRSSFGNHAFTRFLSDVNRDLTGPDSGVAEGIGDACAGPAVFDGTLSDYVLRSVDSVWPYNAPRAAVTAKLQTIDAWEAQQTTAINALTMDDATRATALAAAHDLAEQARAAVRAELAAVESSAVVDGVGVNSLSFASYSGP